MATKNIVFSISIIIQLNFFSLSIFPSREYDDFIKLCQWIIIFLGAWIYIASNRSKNNYLHKSESKINKFYLLFVVALVTNFIFCSINREQNFLVSLKTSLFISQIFFYYFITIMAPNRKFVEDLIMWFALLLYILFIVQLVVFPFQIFNSFSNINESSTDDVRWTFNGQGFLSLGLLLCFNKFTQDFKFKYLLYTIILSSYFILQGSRSILMAISIALLYILYKRKYLQLSLKNFFIWLAMGLAIVMILNIPIIQESLNHTYERSRADIKLQNDYVRFFQLNYFLNNHFINNLEYIFGSGFPGDSNYGRHMHDIADVNLHVQPINWVDLGFLGLAFIAGIPLSLLLIYLLLKYSILSKSLNGNLYIQAWFLYLIFSTIFYPTCFIGGNMVLVAISLYLLLNLNNVNKIKNFHATVHYNTSL